MLRANHKAVGNRREGFTLLEVLVAITILGLAIVALFQVQVRSMRMADRARSLTVAVGLARSKLLDCKYEMLKNGFSIGDFNKDGKFEESAFKGYTWECHGYPFELPVPDTDKLAGETQEKAEGLLPGADLSSGFLAQFFQSLSQPIKESLRELVVIVHWKDGKVPAELKVATHVVDTKPLEVVLGALTQLSGGGNKEAEKDTAKDNSGPGNNPGGAPLGAK